MLPPLTSPRAPGTHSTAACASGFVCGSFAETKHSSSSKGHVQWVGCLPKHRRKRAVLQPSICRPEPCGSAAQRVALAASRDDHSGVVSRRAFRLMPQTWGKPFMDQGWPSTDRDRKTWRSGSSSGLESWCCAPQHGPIGDEGRRRRPPNRSGMTATRSTRRSRVRHCHGTSDRGPDSPLRGSELTPPTPHLPRSARSYRRASSSG